MKKIVLASGSPRRQELLARYIKDFTVKESDIVEEVNPKDSPIVTSMGLAFEKARSVSKSLDYKALVIGSDTIVLLDNVVLGKPKNRDHAREMLKSLSGKHHQVITAIAIIDTEKNISIVDYEKTDIKFRELDDDLIDRYLATGEYVDKAGAYGIQGKASVMVEHIRGCHFNVVGLPLYKLDILLDSNFDKRLL